MTKSKERGFEAASNIIFISETLELLFGRSLNAEELKVVKRVIERYAYVSLFDLDEYDRLADKYWYIPENDVILVVRYAMDCLLDIDNLEN